MALEAAEAPARPSTACEAGQRGGPGRQAGGPVRRRHHADAERAPDPLAVPGPCHTWMRSVVLGSKRWSRGRSTLRSTRPDIRCSVSAATRGEAGGSPPGVPSIVRGGQCGGMDLRLGQVEAQERVEAHELGQDHVRGERRLGGPPGSRPLRWAAQQQGTPGARPPRRAGQRRWWGSAAAQRCIRDPGHRRPGAPTDADPARPDGQGASRIASASRIGDASRRRVLDPLLDLGPVSRAELAGRTGSKRATISQARPAPVGLASVTAHVRRRADARPRPVRSR